MARTEQRGINRFSVVLNGSKALFYFSVVVLSFQSIGQEDWHEAYVPVSLEEAVALCNEQMPDDTMTCTPYCYNYSGLFSLKFKVLFNYLDKVKSGEKNEAKKRFIDMWIDAYQPQMKGVFINEVLFSNNGENYWIYVQEPTLPYYGDELKKKDEVYLYLMFLGTFVVEEDVHYIFVANDFEKR